MPKTLNLYITAEDSPTNIKQKIAIPTLSNKSIDIRIYGQRIKTFNTYPLKIFIMKVNRIVNYCPIRLASKPEMKLLGRIIFYKQDDDYIPECIYSNQLSFSIVEV